MISLTAETMEGNGGTPAHTAAAVALAIIVGFAVAAHLRAAR